MHSYPATAPRAGSTRSVPAAKATVTAPSPGHDPVWAPLYASMLGESLCLFARDILGLTIAEFMLEWEDMIHSHDRIATLAARDHGKSTFWTYAYPIWRAVFEPGCEVYIFGKTQEAAQEYIDIILYGKGNLRGMVDIASLAHLVPTREQAMRDPRLRLNKSDVRFHNGSRIRAVSWGKSTRGRHPKYVVCDDVLSDEDMWSETTRKKNIEYFKGAITNMPPPDGQLIVVGTPFHAADLYNFLRNNKRYAFKKFAGIVREGGKERALFPKRWTLKRLYQKREEIGSVSFAREILCEPITDDLSIFPSHLFPPLHDGTLRLRPKRSVIKSLGWTVYMGVDLALSANVGADYTVLFVIAKGPDGQRFVVDIVRTKGLPFRQQLDLIERVARRYDPNLIFIEANLFQRIYSDEMRRTTDLPVKPFLTHAHNKNPLDKGIPSLRILLENEKYTIPFDKSDPYTVENVTTWESEASQFGFVDGKLQGIGEHDDTVMAWWLAEEACKAGGFTFAMGDDEETGEDGDIVGASDTNDGDDDWKREMGLTDDEEDDEKDDESDGGEDYDDPFGLKAPRGNRAHDDDSV